jgi:hypothetical protein
MPVAMECIACPWCARVSYNANDVAHRYCGWCEQFHDDLHAHQAVWLHLLKQSSGYSQLRPLTRKPGSWAGLMKLMYTTAIVEGRFGQPHDIYDRWCYHDQDSALAALTLWHGDDEPRGWHRHPMSGRRIDRETGAIIVRH